MSQPPDDFLAFLAASRLAYLDGLPGKLAALEALWTLTRDVGAPEVLEDLERGAHSIAGSAGAFGAALVGKAGQALERAVCSLAAADAASRPAARAEARAALDALGDAIGAP